MSDETPRNDAGQFASAEPLTGQAGIEADHGYVPMDDAPQDHPEAESDLRTEAARLAESRVPDDPIIDLGYRQTSDGEPTPAHKTVSLEKAASDLGTYHQTIDEEVRRVDDATLARHVDSLRAEALADNPDIARDLGLSAEKVAAAKAAEAEAKGEEPTAAVKAEKTVEPTADDPYANIEGLDEPTKAAMRVPQIREAVEKEITKAAETQQAYTAALQQGQQVARATIASLAPQLNEMPLEMWPQAIQALAEVDPVRGKLVVDTLNNWNTIQKAEAQQQQYQTQVERQRIAAWSKGQDAEVEKVIGKLTPVQGQEFANDTLAFFESNGVPQEALQREIDRNPSLRSKSFQLMAWQAHQYRKMMGAPKAVATKTLPPVTRPGTSVHRSSGDSSGQIAALQKQIAGLTGDKAVRAAAKLARLQRG
jgi:hypothetical protein